MGEKLTLTVPAELDGERLDKALAEVLGVSRSAARSLVESGARLEGREPKPNSRVRAGDVIETEAPATQTAMEAEPVAFDVLYSDDHVIVVDKPAGIVVHPGSGQRTGTLAAGLLDRFPELEGVGAADRWGLVHRLDKDTSGALLVARTQAAFDALTAALRERRVTRGYVALVNGVMSPPTGTIEAPIGRDPSFPTRRSVVRDGKHARTHYRVLENYPDSGVALVSVSLDTGRTHQIRVHFSAIGHPVVGDSSYGSGPDAVAAPRIFLHAARLGFDHPVTGEPMELESPLPPDLAGVVGSLRRDTTT